jgi:hypothetical protein
MSPLCAGLRLALGSRDHRLDFCQLLAQRTGRHLQIVLVLQVEPELRCGAERLAQPQRGVGSDAGRLLRDGGSLSDRIYDPRPI